MFILGNFIRNTFFSHAYLMDIKQLDICTKLHCLPFHVDDNNKVVLTNSKISKLIEGFNVLLSTVMISVFYTRMIYNVKTTELKVTQMLLYAGWSTLITCNYIFKLNYFKRGHENVLLFNAMHELEKEQIYKG